MAKLGKKEEALKMAWADFEKHPSEFGYGRFMQYVLRGEKAEWHKRAMSIASGRDLGEFMRLTTVTN